MICVGEKSKMGKNKKIAIVISSLHKGGAERAVSELTLNWPADWDIDLIINSRKEKIEYPFRGNLIDLGMRLHENKLDVLYQLKVLIMRTKKLRELKKKNKYAACISFMDSANFANILSGNKYCKVIGSVHISLKSDNTLQYRYLVRPMVRLLYNRADKIVGVSEDISRDLVNLFKIKSDKVTTINNGYDIGKIRNLAAQELDDIENAWLCGSENIIVTMGRLEQQKAQWHIIRAMLEIKKGFPDARLLVMGEGSQRKRLESLIRELNLEDSVILCGVRDNPFRIISWCKVFAMSSMFEGFPQVIPEAMCCGAACVATDFKTGLREIMDPSRKIVGTVKKITLADYGIITPECDGKLRGADCGLTAGERKLANAVCRLLGDKDLRERYGQLGRERSEELSIQKNVKRYMELVKGEKVKTSG